MTATTATASTRRTVSNALPGFGATLSSEWTKLRSVRSTWIMVSLAIGLSIGFSALVALATGLTIDSMSNGVQSSFDPALTSMSGWLFGLVLLIVFGVTAVTGEYSSGMIRTTFIVNPQRGRVFAAKAMIVGALGVAISAISVPGMFLVSQPIFGHYGLATASITDSDTLRLLLVKGSVDGLVYTLLPFTIAWLLRGAGGAITASIGLCFLPWMLAPLLPAWAQHNVLRYLAVTAADSLSGVLNTGDTTYLSQTAALLVVAIWLVGAFVAAAFVLNRRDV